MNAEPIEGERLTTWRVLPGGNRIALDFVATDGGSHSIVLSVDALSGLMMTLPLMLQTALDERFPNGAFRIVQQLAGWQLEQQAAADGLILKLRTAEGFEVSFALATENAGCLGVALLEPPTVCVKEIELMNVMTEIHPFLDGKPKRMLIGGKWLEAASGKTFETHNPATGEMLAHVAEGDAEDIDRAVAAAREAFNGPWSKFKPAQRQAILLKLADLVERNIEELAALDTLDMGAPITPHARRTSRARWACCVSMPAWRRRCMAKRSRTHCRAKSFPSR